MIYSVGYDHFLSIYTLLYITNLYLCVYTFFFRKIGLLEFFFTIQSIWYL